MSEQIDIDKIIDKPLNELTEEEAEAVIAYRVQIATRDEAFQESLRLAEQATEQMIADSKAVSDKCADMFEQMVAEVMAR